MGNIVDFNKAKREADKKKTSKENLKAKNQRLAQKRKRYDSGMKFKPYHFYIALLIVITIFILIFGMQPS